MVEVLRSRMAWAACKSSSPCVRNSNERFVEVGEAVVVSEEEEEEGEEEEEEAVVECRSSRE